MNGAIIFGSGQDGGGWGDLPFHPPEEINAIL
jgi:hypothetical protein